MNAHTRDARKVNRMTKTQETGSCKYCPADGKYYKSLNLILCINCLAEIMGFADDPPEAQPRPKKDKRTRVEKMCDSLILSGFKEDRFKSGKYRCFKVTDMDLYFYVGRNGALRCGKNIASSVSWGSGTKKRLEAGETIDVMSCQFCGRHKMTMTSTRVETSGSAYCHTCKEITHHD